MLKLTMFQDFFFLKKKHCYLKIQSNLVAMFCLRQCYELISNSIFETMSVLFKLIISNYGFFDEQLQHFQDFYFLYRIVTAMWPLFCNDNKYGPRVRWLWPVLMFDFLFLSIKQHEKQQCSNLMYHFSIHTQSFTLSWSLFFFSLSIAITQQRISVGLGFL